MSRRPRGENSGEIFRGRVPLEEMQSWFNALGEDDPPGTQFDPKEVQDFFDNQVSNSAADAVERGITFEKWFEECSEKFKLRKKDIEIVKPKFKNAFDRTKEIQAKLLEEAD